MFSSLKCTQLIPLQPRFLFTSHNAAYINAAFKRDRNGTLFLLQEQSASKLWAYI
jgi:hypothetical protein